MIRPKIAFVTPEYPHSKTGSAGGIGTSLYTMSHALSNQGIEVSVVVYGQKTDAIFQDGNVNIYQVKNVKLKPFSMLLTGKKVSKLLNSLFYEGKINAVEVADWTGFGAGIHVKMPKVVRLNGSDTYFCHFDKRPVKFKNKWFEKQNLLKADGHLSVSAFTSKMTNELFGLQHEYSVIPNMVNTDKFIAMGEGDGKTILYLGTLIRKKGLLELPEIFNLVVQKNPEARLVLVGKDASDIQTGSNSTWQLMQEKFTAEALSRVTYVGAVPYEQVQAYIKQAAVCVFPTFAEALPLAWMEAMAMEKAIVASNIGWATEMIEHQKSGMLAHPTDHQNFANYIIDVLSSAELRTKLGKEARNKAIRDFGADVVTKKNIDYYEKLVNR